MRLAARGLRTLGDRFDVIISSPLVRALQTAEIVAREVKHKSPIEICPALAPGLSPELLFQFLGGFPDAQRVLLVGHEPDLGNFALTLLGGARPDRFPLRKGGVCRVDVDHLPPDGTGTLVWAVTPRILRDLGR
jgi:phosphohistidine phosphatase